jgi:UDP-2,3-diacylglucosamine pyrophosphatase LpxH
MNSQSGQFNTLVISDLHLGEDLSPTATEATRLHVELVERQLLQFLRHYTRRREEGRPWRLVINGDLIDFLSISIRPDHPQWLTLGGGVSPEDHLHGLARTPRAAVAVIDAVAARHLEVFRALARFLARGNRVELICGNHDTELTWDTSQVALRDHIARAWQGTPDAARPGAPDAAALTGRVAFHKWFFYEAGSLWIEHGHQYDENCSFEHQLDPCRPGTEQIAMNVDAAGIRYVTNRIQNAESHSLEAWSLLGYMRFGWGLGLRGCLRLARAYMRFSGAMMAAWRRNRATRSARDEQRAAHQERLRRLAAACSLTEGTLASVDGMRSPPVVGDLRKVASVVMVDRLVVLAAGALAALAALAVVPAPLATVIAVAALVATLFGVRHLGRHGSVDTIAQLERAAVGILDRVDARYVVFGHSHEPVARPVGAEGRAYFNTGTWVPSGRPGILRSFTHLVVRHRDSGPVAELCQWRDGLSRAFTPGWRPAALPGRVTPVPALAPAPIRAAD